MKRLFIYILIFLLHPDATGQQARQYSFTHYSSYNGLSSNNVNNIVQDHKGFIWLATLDGLQRFDGNRFLRFRHEVNNPSSIPDNIIQKVMEDGQGNLWIWCAGKIGTFNTDNFRYSEVKLKGFDKSNHALITFLEKDKAGVPIVGIHSKGSYTYNRTTNQFEQTESYPDVYSKYPYIGYHYSPATEEYWFAGIEGMSLYNAKTGKLNTQSNNPDNNAVIRYLGTDKYFINVYGMHDGLFWYASWPPVGGAPYINSLNPATGEKQQYSMMNLFDIGYNEIVGILKQKNGRLWFYGKTFIVEYTGGKMPFNLIGSEYKDEQSIKYDKVNDMYEDAQQNIWISTNNGVFVFNPAMQIFELHSLVRPDGSGIVDGPAICGLQLKDGRSVIGSWGTGLYFYDSNFNLLDLPPSMKRFKEPFAIWCMTEHKPTGLVWMGLQGGGFIIYDPVTGKSDNFNPPIFESSTIRQVTEDRQGNLWFGMQGGQIVKWDLQLANSDPRKGYVLVKGRGGTLITKMYTDRLGFIWVGTEGSGLFKYDPITHRLIDKFHANETRNRRLWTNNIGDIMQYNDSLLLVASAGINVIDIKNNTIDYIGTHSGLPSNTVNCFQKDNKGMVWLGLAHGLCQMNLGKKLFTLYDRTDGIRSDNFLAAGAFRMNDGRLLFTTEHSFIVFDPAKSSTAPTPADPRITAFRIGNKFVSADSLSKKGRTVLPFSNSSIAIEFNSLNFIKQNKIHYYYMLEDLDKTWHQADQFNQAIYSHLSPGSYTFKVKAVNADGVESTGQTSFVIKVQPPFWRTWWFLGLVLFLILGLLFWLDRLRVQKLRATESIRSRIATSLTEDMSNSISSINISSELAKTKVDVDKERTREYIDQISDTSNRMVQALYDMVWSIDPKNDTMSDTLDRMKSFVIETESIYNVDIEFVVDEASAKLNLDMEHRYELLSIFKEAILNSAKHSGARYVKVGIRLKGSKFFMMIEDDGKGFDTEAASLARGINDMRRRAAAINANIHIESEINTGTIVKVEMRT